jgi:hypothetical protein
VQGENAQQATSGPISAGGTAIAGAAAGAAAMTAGIGGLIESRVFDRIDPDAPATTRSVTPVSVSRNGNVLTVGIVLNTDAAKVGANALSFSLNFDTNVLSLPTNCRPGSAATTGGTANVGCGTSQAAAGRVGVTIDLPVNQTFGFGEQQVALIDFTIAAGAPGTTTISFGDAPTPRFISDINGNRLDTAGTFMPAAVSTLNPTSASVSIAGRVMSGQELGPVNAIVTITDAAGGSRSVPTKKNGSFRFTNVTAGETYILSVTSKRYTYTPQVITVNEDITGMSISPQ